MDDNDYSAFGFDGFVVLLADADYDAWTNDDFGKAFKVTEKTIRNWKKKVDWDAVKDARRKKYGHKIIRVDDAMFKAACKGDVQAARVVYERFDGWTPTTKQVQEHQLDESLIDDELKRLADRRLAAAAAISESVPVDAGQRGEVPGPAAGESQEAQG